MLTIHFSAPVFWGGLPGGAARRSLFRPRYATAPGFLDAGIVKAFAFGLLYGFRDAIQNWSPWATFSLSPLRGRGQGEGARVVYPKHSSVKSADNEHNSS